LCLHRLLPQQFVAACESPKELIVQIVAVGDHDQRRVLHRWMQYDPSGIERHRQTLARALRVPHHADSLVAARSGSPGGRIHRRVHRVILVIPGHLLNQNTTADILEDDEVPDQIQKAPPFEHALKDHPELR